MSPGRQPPIASSDQTGPLIRVFLARFFDNEISGGSADLRMTFFWLIAFLAVPGVFMAILISPGWDLMAAIHGVDRLRELARAQKVTYLGLAMIASGAVSAIVWNSVLLDRQDALVLGTLPIRARTVVGAKLASIAIYVGALAVGTNALASVAFGFFLAAHNTVGFALRGVLAHFVASCAAGAFVCIGVIAMQGLAFVAAGPRRFARVSPWIQVVVVAAVLASLVVLPLISASVVDTLAQAASSLHAVDVHPPAYARASVNNYPWILKTPPVWFLGIYEIVLGTNDPVQRGLGVTAIGALLAAFGVTAFTYPLAYRRLFATVVETPQGGARRRLARWIGDGLTRVLCALPQARASGQFFLASAARSSRHRIAVASFVGAALAVAAATLISWWEDSATLTTPPPLEFLALPLEAMVGLLAGLRVAAALPTDLRAGWILASIAPPSRPVRSGLWRIMFVFGAVSVVVVATPIYWYVWGARVAVLHASVCLAVGAVLTEAYLWGSDGVPCSRPWRPEHANLRLWWPAYLAGSLLVTGGLPALERRCLDSPIHVAALVGGVLLIGGAVRFAGLRRRIMPDEDLDQPGEVQVLNLN